MARGLAPARDPMIPRKSLVSQPIVRSGPGYGGAAKGNEASEMEEIMKNDED